MLENQGFSDVSSNISQRPGKIFPIFQKIPRGHGLKRPFLALLLLGKIHVIFLRVFKLQSSVFFSKNTDFLFVDLKIRGFIFLALKAPFLNVSGAQLFRTPKIIT